ncbi:MAG: hypothetical protein AB1716_00185 [Planctomycetota bacterium]
MSRPGESRERLLPLLYRRISLTYFQAERRRRGLPVESPPALAEVLAVYLAQALPAWAVAALGPEGVLRVAREFAAVLMVAGRLAVPVLVTVRAAWHAWKWVRRRAQGSDAREQSTRAQRDAGTSASAARRTRRSDATAEEAARARS